jgi:hypothetical protein
MNQELKNGRMEEWKNGRKERFDAPGSRAREVEWYSDLAARGIPRAWLGD